MTQIEKLKAINERLNGKIPPFDDPAEISVMLIVNILGNLYKKGLIKSPYSVTSLGKDFISICEEFDWKITDEEIQMFCEDIVPPEHQQAFIYLIKLERNKTNE